jgi:general secretion pathway protein E
MVMDDRIRDAVMSKMPTNQLKRVAIEQGMESMRAAAIKKVLQGATTIEQAVELTFED